MKYLSLLSLSVLYLSRAVAAFSNITVSNSTEQRRTAETCADPSLAFTFVEGYSPSAKTLSIEVRSSFIGSAAVGGDWQILGEIFQAWRTQQTGTVPLYRLYNPTTRDYLFLLSTTGSAPTVIGYGQPGVLVYVYATQICNSVPIYSLLHPNNAHWYTSVTQDRDELIADGWLDEGVIAYALPLASECGCSS